MRTLILGLASLALVACKANPTQTPVLVLGDDPGTPRLSPAVVALATSAKTTAIKIGPKGMEVPIEIDWNRVKDQGCTHVAAVKVRRNGGDPGVVVKAEIAPARGDCVSLLNGPPDMFDEIRVKLDWTAHHGMKSYESKGHAVTLSGDGRVDALDDLAE